MDIRINAEKLHMELVKTGIGISGCNSNGVVWDDDNNEIQDRKDVKEILKKHDPTPIPIETLEDTIAKEVTKQLKGK